MRFIFFYLIDSMGFSKVYGGETGIRTLDTLRYTRFPSVRLQPLGHLSAISGLIESNTNDALSKLDHDRTQGACTLRSRCNSAAGARSIAMPPRR
jgi:hypothetical protein